MKKLLFIPLLYICLQSYATNYYVKTGGSDSANGLSDATAWATIGKINSSMSLFKPGDSILFKKGSTWLNATIKIGTAGSSGNNIVISSYGSGAKPIISAPANAAAIIVSSANRGYWTIDDLDLRATSAPSGIYSTLAIYHGYWLSDLGPVPNWIVQNCTFNSCIMLSGPNTIVRNNVFNGAGNSYNRGGGITFRGPECDNVVIENNEVYNFIGRGIWIYNGGSDPVVRNNFVHDITGNDDNSGTGINIDGYGVRVTGGKVYDNYVLRASASGIAFENGYNAEIYNNKVENCGWGGFMIWQYSQYMGVDCNVNIHHNIVRNGENGVVVYGAAAATIANNTFIKDDATRKDEGAFFVASSSETVSKITLVNNIISGNWAHPVKVPDTKNIWTEFDYNLISGTHVISRGSTNLSLQQTQSLGYMTHGYVADPKYVAPPANLQLQSGSPAINTGKTMNYFKDFAGNAIDSQPDMGAYEFMGIAPSPVVIPEYVSSEIRNISPKIIEITYNTILAEIVPSVSTFNVKVNSTLRTVSSVAVSGTKVSLTLSDPVNYNDAVTLTYLKPSETPLQSVSGGQAVSISDKPVTNNVNPPLPQYISSVITNAASGILEITYDLLLSETIPAASAYAVNRNSSPVGVSSVTVSGTKVLLALSQSAKYGDTISVTYTRPAENPLKSTSGAIAESFTAKKVTVLVEPDSQTPETPSQESGMPGDTISVGISISPDPVKDYISVSNFNPGNDVFRLVIKNMAGKIYKEVSITDESSVKNIPISLNPGFYICQILKGSEAYYTQKIIVVKK